MPELPEVETFVRGLLPAVGQRIAAAEVLDAKLAVSGEDLAGARIAAIRRRGKYIGIEFDDGRALVVHLRMSGSLRFGRGDGEQRYARMILQLDDGTSVCFVDPKYAGSGPDEQDELARYYGARYGMRVLHADPAELTFIALDTRSPYTSAADAASSFPDATATLDSGSSHSLVSRS